MLFVSATLFNWSIETGNNPNATLAMLLSTASCKAIIPLVPSIKLTRLSVFKLCIPRIGERTKFDKSCASKQPTGLALSINSSLIVSEYQDLLKYMDKLCNDFGLHTFLLFVNVHAYLFSGFF